MIVTCPQCSARFRLAEAVATAVGAGRRLKCPDCQHRWHPGAGPMAAAVSAPVDEEEELAAATAELSDAYRAAVPRIAAAAPPADPGRSPPAEPEESSPAAPGRSPQAAPGRSPQAALGNDAAVATRWPLLKTGMALVLGLTLAVGAAGLWIGDFDPDRLPPPLDRFTVRLRETVGTGAASMAGPSPLTVAVAGQVSTLPSGERILEVTGSVGNVGAEPVRLAPLRATLSGPGGIARRWTITPRVDRLGPGASTDFTSTATAVPADATAVTVRTR